MSQYRSSGYLCIGVQAYFLFLLFSPPTLSFLQDVKCHASCNITESETYKNFKYHLLHPLSSFAVLSAALSNLQLSLSQHHFHQVCDKVHTSLWRSLVRI
ncbi:hypothetical protein 1013_scaffold1877_00022 [Bacteriophage sp.]|nr:hypothetical protein 1013_scaffold1877_00022 [Bacteriophage sp.]